MNATIDLEISEKDFNELRDEAIKTAEADAKEYEYERESELKLKECVLEINDGEFSRSEDSLFIMGDLKYKGKGFGSISITLGLDISTALDIVESYIKKLGKVKTILEATK